MPWAWHSSAPASCHVFRNLFIKFGKYFRMAFAFCWQQSNLNFKERVLQIIQMENNSFVSSYLIYLCRIKSLVLTLPPVSVFKIEWVMWLFVKQPSQNLCHERFSNLKISVSFWDLGSIFCIWGQFFYRSNFCIANWDLAQLINLFLP